MVITLVDDHLHLLNWSHFHILVRAPLILVIGCIVFSNQISCMLFIFFLLAFEPFLEWVPALKNSLSSVSQKLLRLFENSIIWKGTSWNFCFTSIFVPKLCLKLIEIQSQTFSHIAFKLWHIIFKSPRALLSSANMYFWF